MIVLTPIDNAALENPITQIEGPPSEDLLLQIRPKGAQNPSRGAPIPIGFGTALLKSELLSGVEHS